MKIIERVVEATYEPNKNDLWLKPEEGGSATLNRYAGDQWYPIGGSSGSESGSGSGSGCDCDTSDFIRLSDLNVTFPYPAEEDLEDNAVFIEDNNVEKRMLLASVGLLRNIVFIRENGMSDLVLTYNDDFGTFVSRNSEWVLYPADQLPPPVLAELNVPEDSTGTGWVLTYNDPETL